MENNLRYYRTQLAPNIHILLHAEFSAMDYTLNIVSKCRFFFIFKHSQAPKRSWKCPGFFYQQKNELCYNNNNDNNNNNNNKLIMEFAGILWTVFRHANHSAFGGIIPHFRRFSAIPCGICEIPLFHSIPFI